MMNKVIRVTLALLVINQLLTSCEALGGYGRRSYGNGKEAKAYKDTAQVKNIAGGTTSGFPVYNATKRGLGVSAWGLITIIVALILAGVGFYYFSICYPIMCKKTPKGRYHTPYDDV